MVSMIKKYILPLVLLSSCTFIDYKQIPALTYRAIAGADDIPIDNDFIEQQEKFDEQVEDSQTDEEA